MYNRMYKFFSDNNLIYTLDKNINLGEGNVCCSIFVYLQKAFDTVEHDILSNRWFKSYLRIRIQYVSINGYGFNLADVRFRVPQGSVLGLLLFLGYINDLNQALKLKVLNVHHFSDDKNLIHFSKSVYRLNKYLKRD